MKFSVKGQGVIFNKTDLEKAIIEKCEVLGKAPMECGENTIRRRLGANY